MWPRVTEVVLALWLLASPAVLGSGSGGGSRLVPWMAGAVVLLLSASSFVDRFRRNHLGNLGVALFLVAWGWSQAPRPGPAWAQNLILTGLVLALIVVVPTRAADPPEGWAPWVAGEE